MLLWQFVRLLGGSSFVCFLAVLVCLLTVLRSSDEYQRAFFNEWGHSIHVMIPFCGYADMPRTSNRRILLYSKSTQGKVVGIFARSNRSPITVKRVVLSA
ncbi:hypothetical protein GQ457_06G009480 [Hibiscus cannabinus]